MLMSAANTWEKKTTIPLQLIMTPSMILQNNTVKRSALDWCANARNMFAFHIPLHFNGLFHQIITIVVVLSLLETLLTNSCFWGFARNATRSSNDRRMVFATILALEFGYMYSYFRVYFRQSGIRIHEKLLNSQQRWVKSEWNETAEECSQCQSL